MSTDAVEDQVESGADDGYEPALRPPVGDMGEEKAEQATTIPWLPDADEETVKYLTSRGWDKNPQGALAAQREAEAALRREQQARASMEEELAEARELAEQGQAPPAAQGDDPFGIVAAATAYENGEITMAQFAQHQTHATLLAAQQIAQEMIGEQVSPLAQDSTRRTMEETAASLAATYPDFADLSEDVLEMIERNPSTYGSAEGMRAAYGLVRAGRDASAASQARRARQAETLDTGGRGNGAADAHDAIKKQLREVGGRRDDL